MNAVSGATFSSKAIKSAYNAAIAKAKGQFAIVDITTFFIIKFNASGVKLTGIVLFSGKQCYIMLVGLFRKECV